MQVQILDGGMGDILAKLVGRQDCADWSACCLTDPTNHHLVSRLHEEFIQAGASMITTCNFSLRRFNGYSDEQIYAACQSAADLAFECKHKNKNLKVIGSLPPLGACFLNHVPTTLERRSSLEYDVMIQAMQDKCDVFLAETMSSVEEAMLVYEALERNKVNKPWMVSFAITREGTLFSGQTCAFAVEQLLQTATTIPPLTAIMFNCSPPQSLTKALENVHQSKVCIDLLASKNCALGIYANRYPQMDVGTMQHDTLVPPSTDLINELSPTAFADFTVEAMLRFNLKVVGGCCGIEPIHIAALTSKLLLLLH